MSQPSIAVLGECVADAFASAPPVAGSPAAGSPVSGSPVAGVGGAEELVLRVLPGGGPANTAVALARLGSRARFLGRISGDAFGALFRRHLAASGVNLSGVVAAAEPSTMAIADLDEHGRARYSFHAEGTADWQWTDAELAAAPLADAHCLHTGSLALIREPGGRRVEDLLARAREHATVSIDPNVRPLLVDPARYRARLERWCELADILRLSSDDLELLLPGATPEEACTAWHRAGARLVVITLGADGALASLGGERVRVPAVPVQVVDTVGAGDSFTAGLLHHLARLGHLGGRLTTLTPADLAAACTFATRVAAHTCTTTGPNPPWAHQLHPLPPTP